MPIPIRKNQLTLFSKLLQRKHREHYGLFLAEGLRTVEQVLSRNKVKVQGLVLTERALEVVNDLKFLDGSTPIPVWVASETDFARLADTGQHQGILAVCEIPPPPRMDDFLGLQEGLLLAVDRIQDPGNLGTMIRTGAWFSIDGVLSGEGTVDVFNPKVVRSTAGSTGALPVLEGSLENLMPEFQSAGWEIVLLDAGIGSVDLKGFTFPKRTVLLVGNEGNGVSEELKRISDSIVRISGNEDNVESLNAAVAVAIALFASTN